MRFVASTWRRVAYVTDLAPLFFFLSLLSPFVFTIEVLFVPYCCGTPPMFGTFCFASFFAFHVALPTHPIPPPFSTWPSSAYKKAAPSLVRIKSPLSQPAKHKQFFKLF